MLKTVGDLTWHYHAGIRTFPFRVAVDRNIPLIVWGEHGFAELTGLVSLKDFVELPSGQEKNMTCEVLRLKTSSVVMKFQNWMWRPTFIRPTNKF